MNFQFSHIPFGRLVDWVEKTLSPTDQEQIQHHLENCAHCRNALADAQRLITVMQSDRAVDPPPAVLARALALFQPRIASPAPNLVQRLLATLQFDSLQATPALGLRTEGTTVQQLLYTAGDYDVDLRLTQNRTENTCQLSGQLFGGEVDELAQHDPAHTALSHHQQAGQVALMNEEHQVQVPLTALNEFVLPAVPVGEYTLVVTMGDVEITIASLQLGR